MYVHFKDPLTGKSLKMAMLLKTIRNFIWKVTILTKLPMKAPELASVYLLLAHDRTFIRDWQGRWEARDHEINAYNDKFYFVGSGFKDATIASLVDAGRVEYLAYNERGQPIEARWIEVSAAK